MTNNVVKDCTFTPSPELDAARMRRQIGRLLNWIDANDVDLDFGDKVVLVAVPANLLRDLIDTF